MGKIRIVRTAIVLCCWQLNSKKPGQCWKHHRAATRGKAVLRA